MKNSFSNLQGGPKRQSKNAIITTIPANFEMTLGSLRNETDKKKKSTRTSNHINTVVVFFISTSCFQRNVCRVPWSLFPFRCSLPFSEAESFRRRGRLFGVGSLIGWLGSCSGFGWGITGEGFAIFQTPVNLYGTDLQIVA